MAVLSAEEIGKRIKITPFHVDSLGPCSYLLHAKDAVRLNPVTNTFALLRCREKIIMPKNIAGLIVGVPELTLCGVVIVPLLIPQEWSGEPLLTISLSGPDPQNIATGDVVAQVRFEVVR